MPGYNPSLCGHLDSHGRRYQRTDCPSCTPLQYRCTACYQEKYERKWVRTRCDAAALGPRGGKGDHVTAIEGFGSLCALCGRTVFVHITVKDDDGLAVETACTLTSGHELAVYPFRCDLCKGSVSMERPSTCTESYTGEHLISSGFVKLSPSDMQRIRPSYKVEYDPETLRKFNEVIEQQRRSWRKRRFVSKKYG